MRSAVLGAGSWGTVVAAILADAGGQVNLLARRLEVAERMQRNRVNGEYLPDLVLPEGVTATADAATALADVDAVFLAVPAQTLRDNLRGWLPSLPDGVPLVSLMKGIEHGTVQRMSEVIVEAAAVDPARVVVVSGPNLSHELAARQPAGGVVACSDLAAAEVVAQALAAPYFRPYTQTDVVGTEIGGAVKNVVALAAGMAEGLGYGDNTKATIITRGLAETARLGAALGADPATFMGLAGVGDLIATCMSPLSRNHAFGVRLGRGGSMAQAQIETTQVTEGVKSCLPIRDLARRHGVDMPIVQSVTAIVHDDAVPADQARELMGRTLKAEAR